MISFCKSRSLIRFISEPGSTRKLALGFRNSGASNSTTGESSWLRPARRTLLNSLGIGPTSDVLSGLHDPSSRRNDESAESLNFQMALERLA